MNYAVKNAIGRWESEIDAEVVRLIESGVPPYDAVDQARRNVSRRRAIETGADPKKRGEGK